MGGSGYQQVGQIRAGARPTGARPQAVTRRAEAPGYQPGMGGARNMNQVMRPVVPAPQPQRAAYKLTSNVRNQYPVMPQQPEQTAVVMQGQEPLTASLLATASASE